MENEIEKTYKFGFDLKNDLKHLYGENYKKINDKRINLFEKLDDESLEIQKLRNIIQNPVPLLKYEIDEWEKIKDHVLQTYSIKYTTIEALNEIKAFAIKYHVINE